MGSDKNTYAAVGKTVEGVLKDVGKLFSRLVLQDDVVLPDANTIGNVVLFYHDPFGKANIFEYSPCRILF